jgi:hypothetical protein
MRAAFFADLLKWTQFWGLVRLYLVFCDIVIWLHVFKLVWFMND